MGIKNYLAIQLVTVANQAALPASSSDGQLAMVLDDGTGKPAIFIWDSGAGIWILCTGGSVGSLVWQEPVVDKDLNTPPGGPASGDRYIVAAGGVGDWAGQDDNIAEWDGSAWNFTTASEGFAVYVEDEDFIYVYTGAAWVRLSTRIDHGLLLGLGDDDHSQYHNDARGDARYYTETELDAAPAAGAKIDKIIGTDNAILRSDGIVGAVQDSLKSTIADNGTVTFDTTSRIADTPIFLLSNDGTPLFTILASTGNGSIVQLEGDSTDKDALIFIAAFDATAKATLIAGLGGVGAITIEVDLGGASAKIENTLAGPFIVGNNAGLFRLETLSDHQLDLPSNDGSDKVAVRDSDDAEVVTIDSNGNITAAGVLIARIKRTAIADANHTILDSEYLIGYTSITVTRTVALPTAVGREGQTFVVKDESGSVTGAIKITIDPNGAETIDGAATFDIIVAYGAIEFYSDGANWFSK